MSNGGVESAIKWVIVWCDEDKSFSLINEKEAVCDVNHLSMDDEISFTFDNREYEGVVRALGGDDDYDALAQKLKELNATNKKKDDSFHADRPRKTRGGIKFVNAVNALKSRTKQAAPKPTNGDDDKDIKSEEGSSENYDSATTSPDSSPPPEMKDQAKAGAAIKRKGNDRDVQMLKKLKAEEIPQSKPRQSIMGFSFSESPTADELRSGEEDTPTVDDKKHQGEKTSSFENSKETSGKRKNGALSSSDEECGKEDNEGKASLPKKIVKGDEESSSDESAKEDKKRRDKKHEKKRKRFGKIGAKESSSDESAKEDDKKRGDKKHEKKKKRSGKIGAEESSSDESAKEDEKKSGDKKHDKKKKRSGKIGAEESSSDESAKEDEKKSGDKKHDKKKKRSGKIGEEIEESSIDDESPKEDKNISGKDDKKSKKEVNGHGKVVKKDQEGDRKEAKKKEKKKQQVKEADGLDFPVLRCSADDDDVEVISGKSKELANKTFYITTDSLHKAKSAKNASVFCKNLLEAVFTDEALYKCSLSGGEYRAGGRDKIARKPALPSTIVSLIIDVSLHRQQVKKWNPQLSKKELMGGLRQKLVDIRPRLKKMFEKKASN